MKSIYDAAAILGHIAATGGDNSVRSIADALEINKSTVHRILRALERIGYVSKYPRNERYTLGPELALLGRSYLESMNLRNAAMPYLQALQHKTGETVSLSMRIGDRRIFLEQLGSSQLLKATLDISKDYPLYSGAAGKVLLASLDSQTLEDILERIEFVPTTEFTIDCRERLVEEIQQTREQGYAIGVHETVLGVASVAAPVKDATGAIVASVSIVAPSVRLDRQGLLDLRPLLEECTNAISTALGNGHPKSPSPTLAPREA